MANYIACATDQYGRVLETRVYLFTDPETYTELHEIMWWNLERKGQLHHRKLDKDSLLVWAVHEQLEMVWPEDDD